MLPYNDPANDLVPASGQPITHAWGLDINEDIEALHGSVWTESVFDISAYGAVANSTSAASANVTAVNAAVAALMARGAGVLLIPDMYYLNAPIVVSNCHFSVKGYGRDVSGLIWTSAGDGFTFSSSSYSNSVYSAPGESIRFEGLTLATTVVATGSGTTGTTAGSAVNATWVDATSMKAYATFTDVVIAGIDSTATSAWMYGMTLHNCNGLKATDLYIVGNPLLPSGITVDNNSTPWAMEAGIYLTGTSTNGHISHFLTGIGIERANVAFKVDNHYEGIYLNNFEFVYVAIGISSDGSATTAHNPNFFVTNGSINYLTSGAVFVDTNTPRLVNVDLSKGIDATETWPGAAVSFSGCQHFLVANCFINSVSASTTTNEFGVTSDSSSPYGVISGNFMQNIKTTDISVAGTGVMINSNILVGVTATAVDLTSTSTICRSSGNIINGPTTALVNAGTSNTAS